MKLTEIVNVWISGRPKNTAISYTRLVEKWDCEAIKLFKKGLLELTTPQVQGVFRSLSGNLSARSQNCHLWIIKGFYRCAVELGVRPDNPAKPLRNPKFENKLANRIIRHEQVVAMVAAAKSERDKLLIQLMYGAGLRISEAIALTRKNLLGGGRIQVFGKGEKTRYVQIRPELEQKLLAFAAPEGRVFRSRWGQSLTRRTAWLIVSDAANAAGIPGVSPHWLRHAHATEALRRGASLLLVKEQLGHSSVNTTMVYSHVVSGDGSGLYIPEIGK